MALLELSALPPQGKVSTPAGGDKRGRAPLMQVLPPNEKDGWNGPSALDLFPGDELDFQSSSTKN